MINSKILKKVRTEIKGKKPPPSRLNRDRIIAFGGNGMQAAELDRVNYTSKQSISASINETSCVARKHIYIVTGITGNGALRDHHYDPPHIGQYTLVFIMNLAGTRL